MLGKVDVAAELLRNFWNRLPWDSDCQKVAHLFLANSIIRISLKMSI